MTYVTKPTANPQAPWAAKKAGRRVCARDPEWAAPALAKLVADCHPAQRDAAEDPAQFVSVLCARGAGKTTSAEVRLIKTLARKRRARCVFIAVTKEHAADIAWEHFKSIFEASGIEATFGEVKKEITLTKNGSTLKLCGADDKKEIEKLRGRKFDGVVIDEAASHAPAILDALLDRIIGPRLGTAVWIMMIGSPGHTLSGQFYDATRPGSPTHRPYADRFLPEWVAWGGWSSHHWSLEEGAQHVEYMADLWRAALLKKALKQWSDTNPIWMREYLGLWASDDTDNIFKYRPHLAGADAIERGVPDGTPWNQWDPERRGALKIAKLPPAAADDWCWALAYDKGSGRAPGDSGANTAPAEDKSRQDAFAVNAFAFSPSDPKRQIFHVYCGEFVGYYARLFAELCVGDTEAWIRTSKPGEGSLFGVLGHPIGIVGDTDATFLAEMSKVYGIGGVEAKRQREQKHGAIELCNGDLIDGRIKILKGSRLEQQIGQVQWVADGFGMLSEDKRQANGSTDCLAYGRKLIAHLFDSGAVVAVDPASPPPKPREAAPAALPDRGQPSWLTERDQPEWLTALSGQEDDPW